MLESPQFVRLLLVCVILIAGGVSGTTTADLLANLAVG
jgi:hypothetical protein